MAYRVPFVDPRAHYSRLKPEIDATIISCLSQGDLVYRKQLRDFEEHLAAFVGTKYAVGVNSDGRREVLGLDIPVLSFAEGGRGKTGAAGPAFPPPENSGQLCAQAGTHKHDCFKLFCAI